MLRTLLTAIKPYLRWVIIGLTFCFILAALRASWSEVVQLRLRSQGFGFLAIGFGVTLSAHVWSGWVWGWILRDLNQPVTTLWSVSTFLQTNIAKYLPGNIWHFVGRVRAAVKQEISILIAALSVAIEALCMAVAAVVLAIAVLPFPGVIILGLITIAIGLHPRCFNPIMTHWAAGKARQFERIHSQSIDRPSSDPSNLPNLPNRPDLPTTQHSPSHPSITHSGSLNSPIDPDSPDPIGLQHYPWRPLIGELGFVILRGLGFLSVWLALAPISLDDLPRLIGGFSFAWLLGLVIPGAPGGIGVFEATALSIWAANFPTGLILGAIALYRLISIATEALGAGLALGVQARHKF
jgi:glycosyltransferase 2 family protein